ncbi:SGNH/GDSL hydrolase family protein [Paenibacillus sp. Marseille-Q4541]|uniref:rhamnogalacturonan lyase family protein n=1 Tax=Paenibacillus sp. Marseille-Q4541 TaxID=2831522 RepID=UPI0024B614F0|nr:SGNH/GDSL hydrolase family protein [Paenibacillus sp. Marseille-Q4541]
MRAGRGHHLGKSRFFIIFLVILMVLSTMAMPVEWGGQTVKAEEVQEDLPLGDAGSDTSVTQATYGEDDMKIAQEGEYRFDFGDGLVADGYTGINAQSAYSEEIGYGFTDLSTVSVADRGGEDLIRSDFARVDNAVFQIDLPSGDYNVALIAGDQQESSEIAIKAERMQKVQLTAKGAGEFLEMNFSLALVDGQLNLEFTGSAAKLNALVITRLPERTAGDQPTIYIAGDSTVQTYDPYWKPEAGWGQMLPRFFSDQVLIKNHAIGGRSTKSFINEGRLDEILKVIQPEDYFLIQFGHNDATISIPDRYASPADYKEYLRTYIHGAEQRGATPILVTPVGRRDFNPDTGKFNVSFPEYVAAMKEVAVEENTKLVDLSARSVAYYDSIGPEEAKSVFLHTDPGVYGAFPNGSADNTHFQEYGAIQLARMVAQSIAELNLPLSEYVQEQTLPEAKPDSVTGLVAGNISNSGALLKWNAVQQADIYRVYVKPQTDAASAYKLAGTATVPSFSLSGLSEGKSYTARVIAVNGKGSSDPSEEVTIGTKSATYRYDFGPPGAPVAEGYTEINRNILYSKERGYGLTVHAGALADRDRGGATDALRRDFIINFGGIYEFKVDLPNGTYAVKSYTGDWIGSTKTNVNIEGKDYGTVSSGKENIAEKLYSPIAVQDGQINMVFSGQTAHVNGIEITPLLLAPAELKLVQLALENDPPSAELSWSRTDSAVLYRVYRQAEGEAKASFLAETAALSLKDESADIGMKYTYYVTAVDAAGLESVASSLLEVSMIDLSVGKSGVPTELTVTSIHKNDVTFTWKADQKSRSYNVYRSVKENGIYDLIGKSKEPKYTDSTILSTVPYYYKVASVNAGGISDMSEVLRTEAVTTLYRQMENIDRAPVAVKTEEGVFISWRMLGLDPDSITFRIYRDNKLITSKPITDRTNYVDAGGTEKSVYRVEPIVNGISQESTETFSVWQQQYKSIPLDKPADGYTKDGQPYSYYAGDASVGDLDGDGKYEIVLMWSPNNSKDNSQAGYTGEVFMDAYKLDGTKLWRIKMGPNIRAGAHYTQFLVYDFDGDGKAEVAMKTADGTKDGAGVVIGDGTLDHRNSSGYVLLGNEYLTVFEGQTGKALSRVPYDPPRGDVNSWGDGYGNRVDRFLATVAYLDGEHPSLVFSRGYYTRTVLAAYDYRGGELTKRWRFDSNDEGLGSYAGQGNHNLSVGDVDNDGKDEILFGAIAIDDDGTPLHNTGLGHGDAMHFGNLDPEREGLEIFSVHENKNAEYGMEVRDANTGEILWGVPMGIDVGRGMSADIDPNHPGEEVWSATITNAEHIPLSGLYSIKGEKISSKIPSSTNFGIWWDGDLLRELQDDIRIDKWDYNNQTTVNLLTANGAASNNSTKANPSLQADLYGDWREEVVWRSQDSMELRIYTTTDESSHRIRTLMHDPIYRLGVAWQNIAYNQPPHTSFYLGTGMEKPAAPQIRYTGVEENGTAKGKPGLPVLSDNNGHNNGLLDGEYTLSMNMWWGENGTRYKLYENGKLIYTELLSDTTPQAQSTHVPLTGRDNGTYVYTAELINAHGTTKSAPHTVTVKDAAPGKPSISSDNWDQDGVYRITMNMWWGTNGTIYRLYENGEIVDTQELTASTPNAQTAYTEIVGKTAGVYEYQIELANSHGQVRSEVIRVEVK